MNCLYIHCTCAIVIAVAIISLDMNTRIVHLGAAPLLSLAVGNTGELGLSFKYEGEDAGTAGVRSTDCVAAGVRVCVSAYDVSHYHWQENAELQP